MPVPRHGLFTGSWCLYLIVSSRLLTVKRLELEFSPRRGDAVAWSNVDKAGSVDPDMVHEAMPLPDGSTKMAVNIWVRDDPFTSPKQASQRQQ